MSKASKVIIDNATQRAIEQGKLDLRYASPALQQAASEIRTHHSRGGGLLGLFGGKSSSEWSDDILEKARQQTDEQNREQDRREKETERWFMDHHRSPNVPRDWMLRTDNDRGTQTYSDGDRIHYVVNGKVLSDAEEFDKYGGH